MITAQGFLSACSKCQGKIVQKDDLIICAHCGHIHAYVDTNHHYGQPTQPRRTLLPFGLTSPQAKRIFQNPALTSAWLRRTMWPVGPTCPNCGHPGPPQDQDTATCNRCQTVHTPVTGTPMETKTFTPGQWLTVAHATLSGWPQTPDTAALAAAASLPMHQVDTIVTEIINTVHQARDPLAKEKHQRI